MSGDHNMNQTSSAWRKRQIALNKKAENARELGLDYEPDKTVIDMAREADVKPMLYDGQWAVTNLDKFAELVRENEREACIEDILWHVPRSGRDTPEYQRAMKTIARIRARGQA
jgi:hypothetical protein